MLKHIVSKDEVPTPKGSWDIAEKLFKFKNSLFSPKSAMRGPKSPTPPKGTAPNVEAHCVQLQKGAEISLTNYLSSKPQFFSPKSAMCSPKSLRPQDAQLLMLKHIASKDEVPTPKGSWDIAWQYFKFKNIVFNPKFSRAPKGTIPNNAEAHCVQRWVGTPTPKGGWDIAHKLFKFKIVGFQPKISHARPKIFETLKRHCS